MYLLIYHIADCGEISDMEWADFTITTTLPVANSNASNTLVCDLIGGWTLILRRVDSDVDFQQPWEEYVNGFGDVDGNFWLGLKQYIS